MCMYISLNAVHILKQPSSPPSSSNIHTWQVHNALLILRIALKHMLQKLPEDEVILQLDGSTTVPQITSLERVKDREGEEKEGERSGEAEGRTNGLDPLASFSLSLNPPVGVPLAGKEEQEQSGEKTVNRVLEVSDDPSSLPPSVNPAELIAMETLLSRQLVEGLVSLLAEVPLL